jgi:hypothetical protein
MQAATFVRHWSRRTNCRDVRGHRGAGRTDRPHAQQWPSRRSGRPVKAKALVDGDGVVDRVQEMTGPPAYLPQWSASIPHSLNAASAWSSSATFNQSSDTGILESGGRPSHAPYIVDAFRDRSRVTGDDNAISRSGASAKDDTTTGPEPRPTGAGRTSRSLLARFLRTEPSRQSRPRHRE